MSEDCIVLQTTSAHPRRGRQRGVSMLFALMTLAVLSLAAIALVRSVDSGSLVAGNMGFKQDATAASAQATESAIAYLSGNAGGTALEGDVDAQGYYASSLDNLDVTGTATTSAKPMAVVDWQGNGCKYVDSANFNGTCKQPSPEVTITKTNNITNTKTDNKVRWIITRLCQKSGPVDATNACARPKSVSTTTASERGELSSGGRITATVASPYYRIVVRTQSGRNTVSYTETIVHF